MKTIPKTLLIAVAAVVVVAAVSGYCVDARWREFDRRAEQALTVARAEKASADSALTVARAESLRADSLAAHAEALATATRDRIRVIRDTVEVPEPCEEIVAQRDEVIDSLVVEADYWRGAFEAEKSAAEQLRVSNSHLLVAVDSLTNVLEDRPRPRPRWQPSLSVGIFAGVCSTGEVCVGAGAGLTVEVKIPTPRLPWDG